MKELPPVVIDKDPSVWPAGKWYILDIVYPPNLIFVVKYLMKLFLALMACSLVSTVMAVDIAAYPCAFTMFQWTRMTFSAPDFARKAIYGEEQRRQAPYNWDCNDDLFSVVAKDQMLQFKWQQQLTITLELMPSLKQTIPSFVRIHVSGVQVEDENFQVVWVSGGFYRKMIENHMIGTITVSTEKDFKMLLQKNGITDYEIHYLSKTEEFTIRQSESGLPSLKVLCDANLPVPCD